MTDCPKVASPCIEVCELDASGRVCTGCHRTIEEIAQWGSLTNEERARVIASLPGRRSRIEGPSSATRLERCSRCGTKFGCGANDPHNACWCTRYPPVTPRAGQMTCLCPGCLAAALT